MFASRADADNGLLVCLGFADLLPADAPVTSRAVDGLLLAGLPVTRSREFFSAEGRATG